MLQLSHKMEKDKNFVIQKCRKYIMFYILIFIAYGAD